MKTTNNTAALLAGLALLITVMVTMAFWSFNRIEIASEARRHTNSIFTSADNVLSALTVAETGQRGYLLTGDESFLQPYLSVRDSISGNLNILRQQTRISAARIHLDSMAPLVDAKLAEMASAIILRRNNDLTGVLAAVAGGQGQRLMDSIRSEMVDFRQVEETDLVKHEAEFKVTMQRMFIVIIIASLLTLLLAVSYALLSIRRNKQQLEHLIYLETKQLLEIQEESNKQLQQINSTLQESEEELAVTLNSIGDGVIATDAKACVTRLNQIAEQLTGWTLAEAIGQSVDDIFKIINKDSRQPTATPIMDAIAHGTMQGLANHTVLIARNGSEYDIADSCAPILSRDGQVVGAVLVFRNVTREYAVQQSLQDSTALTQTIFNTVKDGIVTIHAHGGIIKTINRAVEKIFGYSADELNGQNFSLLIPNPDRSRCNSSIEDYRESDEEHTQGVGREVVGQRKDGSMFPLEISLTEMHLNGERYFTGILRDVSTRKQVESTIIKNGALQTAIFNSANFSSIATDAKGVIQIFNVGAERMLGYSAIEVMNKITPADISDPQEVITRAEVLSSELATPITPGFEALVFKASRGIEDIYELTYIRKDGSRFPAVVSVTALRDEQETIIGYLLIGTDNTARKEIEAEQILLSQRLRDHQFYTRSLFECNIDAIMTTDPACIITDVNKQMEILTGCTRDELIGAPFKNYFTDADLAETSIKKVLSEKQVTNYELTARARDGMETVVSINATTFYDRDRKLQGVFAAARDVTERKRLDQVLHEKNVELESAKAVAEKTNLAKSDFLANMSHELRTPLNSVIGFSEVLQDQMFGQINEKQYEYINNILTSGRHLLSLINDILDLSKVESGKMELELSTFSLRELLDAALTMLREKAHKGKLTVTMEITPQGDITIVADQRKLKQILFNLLSNAIKFTPEGGTVDISALRDGGFVKITVTDNGMGIKEEDIPKLFQAFTQLESVYTKVHEGTGLGLVLTRQLVELHGGTVWVKSDVGTGSRFSFTIPLMQSSAKDPESSYPQ